jgi:senataxin
VIVNPKIFGKEIKNYFSIPNKLSDRLIELYNESQLTAIKETLKKEGITLIQGPPGTGKTTTVLGTLSVLFNSNNGGDELSADRQRNENEMIVESEENSIKNFDNYNKMMPWLNVEKFENW